MSTLKILTAAIAAATFSLAFAQGTPPRPATDPAVGAGQRSTENTPMGTTGTPGTGGTASGTAAAPAAGTSTMNAGSATADTQVRSSTAMADTQPRTTHKAKKHKRVKKADRN